MWGELRGSGLQTAPRPRGRPRIPPAAPAVAIATVTSHGDGRADRSRSNSPGDIRSPVRFPRQPAGQGERQGPFAGGPQAGGAEAAGPRPTATASPRAPEPRGKRVNVNKSAYFRDVTPGAASGVRVGQRGK